MYRGFMDGVEKAESSKEKIYLHEMSLGISMGGVKKTSLGVRQDRAGHQLGAPGEVAQVLRICAPTDPELEISAPPLQTSSWSRCLSIVQAEPPAERVRTAGGGMAPYELPEGSVGMPGDCARRTDMCLASPPAPKWT